MKPAELFPILASDLAEVDAVIRTQLHSEVALINTIADYIIGAGGKRMPAAAYLKARSDKSAQTKIIRLEDENTIQSEYTL